MSDDDSFSYQPEVEQSFSEVETQKALEFIKEMKLPMSDLYLALKYVRISNREVELDGKIKEIEQRLKKLRNEYIVVVSPPSSNCDNADI